jgi:hypothetical protein
MWVYVGARVCVCENCWEGGSEGGLFGSLYVCVYVCMYCAQILELANTCY